MTARIVRVALALLLPLHSVVAQQTPTFGELHDRFVAAVGGRSALDRHSGLRLAGTITVEGMSGQLEVWRDRTGRFRQRTALDGIGVVEQGYDGRIAWTVQPSGPALLTGDLEASVRRQGDWYGDITPPTAAASAVVERATFEGEATWKATYVSAEGPEMSVHFSVATGLRVGYSSTTPMGESVSVLADYEVFGGVRLPTKITNRIPEGQVFIRYTTVEFAPLAPEAFAAPASVRALLGRGTDPN
jgi:hypothetical protein